MEDVLEEGNVEDDEVEEHGQTAGGEDPQVVPRGDDEERLILGQGVEGVEHLDQDENRQ